MAPAKRIVVDRVSISVGELGQSMVLNLKDLQRAACCTAFYLATGEKVAVECILNGKFQNMYQEFSETNPIEVEVALDGEEIRYKDFVNSVRCSWNLRHEELRIWGATKGLQNWKIRCETAARTLLQQWPLTPKGRAELLASAYTSATGTFLDELETDQKAELRELAAKTTQIAAMLFALFKSGTLLARIIDEGLSLTLPGTDYGVCIPSYQDQPWWNDGMKIEVAANSSVPITLPELPEGVDLDDVIGVLTKL